MSDKIFTKEGLPVGFNLKDLDGADDNGVKFNDPESYEIIKQSELDYVPVGDRPQFSDGNKGSDNFPSLDDIKKNSFYYEDWIRGVDNEPVKISDSVNLILTRWGLRKLLEDKGAVRGEFIDNLTKILVYADRLEDKKAPSLGEIESQILSWKIILGKWEERLKIDDDLPKYSKKAYIRIIKKIIFELKNIKEKKIEIKNKPVVEKKLDHEDARITEDDTADRENMDSENKVVDLGFDRVEKGEKFNIDLNEFEKRIRFSFNYFNGIFSQIYLVKKIHDDFVIKHPDNKKGASDYFFCGLYPLAEKIQEINNEAIQINFIQRVFNKNIEEDYKRILKKISDLEVEIINKYINTGFSFESGEIKIDLVPLSRLLEDKKKIENNFDELGYNF